MIRCQLSLMVVCLMVVGFSGCSMVETPKLATHRMTRANSSNPNDRDSEASQDVEEWGAVGDEGRASQNRERDPDPWFKKYLMSKKANSIERNLGID